jgi:hypothetical protein
MDGKRSAAPEAHVGIFWLYNGKVIIDSTTLSDAEPYGDALTHSISHIDYWTALQERGDVPKYVEYEEQPRGRVVYDKRKEHFFLWADWCIASRIDVVGEIIEALNLPPDKTSTGLDAHYRCAMCLVRIPLKSEDDEI